MTEFELGFRRGERDAWDARKEPLPMAQKVNGEYARGYWSARLPRTSAWASNRIRAQQWCPQSEQWEAA